MRVRCLAAIVLALSIPAAASAADMDTQNATDAAKSWLALVDADNYVQSWNLASAFFRTHVTEAQWQSAAKAARDPMGPVLARNIASVDFTSTLPGAPDGRYVVVKFDTKFANKAAAIETTAMAMDGGSWKAAGYYVR
jgi:uncharacterized protein DUF4019